MKKLLLLSLLAIYLNAQNTIADIFKDGNINAQMQLFYYNIDRDIDSHAIAAGGYLRYSTDTNRSIFASVRFHTSNPIISSQNAHNTSLVKKDGSAITTMSESFLAYKTNSRILKLGSFIISTPMMNDDPSRIVPWSYRGFAYTGELIKDFKVQLYYIDGVRSNTADRYSKQSPSGKFDNITMFSIYYNALSGLKAQAYYYYAPKLYSTFVAQVDYDIALNSERLLCFGLQYFKSGDGGRYAKRDARNGGDDIDLVALKTSIDAKDWYLSLNYSKNFGDSGVVTGYGGSAKVYTSSMMSNGRGDFKPETWMLKGSHDLNLGKYHSELALTLTDSKTEDKRGDDLNAYYLHFKHFFTKEASIFLRYEFLDYSSSKKDAHFFRAIASYEF